jgi:hypothetical protein
MVLYCGCSGSSSSVAFQDARYGVGHRVHNPTTKEKTWRCSICSKERFESQGPPPDSKGKESGKKSKEKVVGSSR